MKKKGKWIGGKYTHSQRAFIIGEIAIDLRVAEQKVKNERNAGLLQVSLEWVFKNHSYETL